LRCRESRLDSRGEAIDIFYLETMALSGGRLFEWPGRFSAGPLIMSKLEGGHSVTTTPLPFCVWAISEINLAKALLFGLIGSSRRFSIGVLLRRWARIKFPQPALSRKVPQFALANLALFLGVFFLSPSFALL